MRRLVLLDGTVRSFVTDNMYLTRCTAELEELLQVEEDYYSRPHLISFDAALGKLKNRLFPVTEKVARSLLARTLIKTDKGLFTLYKILET